ncbi:MAG: pilin [Proteobacteria bacterium]|nr:pilin [Pseudomonadota bacterium]MBS0462535.1 pilin [Pseudomonadota bacterium]
MNKLQQGFTLIELMIVVAIIAILAAIAIPAYQDYVIRSQVSEGSSLAEGSKTALAEFYSNKGRFPGTNVSAGVATDTSINGNYVTKVTVGGAAGSGVGATGTITVTYGNQANALVATKVLVFKATGAAGSTTWACTTAAGSNVNPKYRPSICRP